MAINNWQEATPLHQYQWFSAMFWPRLVKVTALSMLLVFTYYEDSESEKLELKVAHGWLVVPVFELSLHIGASTT